MEPLHIITPVKDSLELTVQTIKSILGSETEVPFKYTVYNDFSTRENTARLSSLSKELGFELVNLEDITTSPSPNYRLTLRLAQKRALEEGASLLIVESDVVVRPDTVQKLYDSSKSKPDCAIAASVTVDENGEINYPYLFAKKIRKEAVPIKKHCSFCCSILTNRFLKEYDFNRLDPSKNWYDVSISQTALKMGFRNYLFLSLPVWHRPHASRPWKQLKYTSPFKYYWYKIVKGQDKI